MFSRLRWWTSSQTLAAPARLFSQTPHCPRKTPPPTAQDQRCRHINILPKRHRAWRTEDCTSQNKTNSAVQIIHKPSGVVIKCQATRSQSQNAKIARSLLADRVEAREKGDNSRVAIKAAAAKKKKASNIGSLRRGLKEGEIVEEEEDEIEIIWDDDVKEGENKEGESEIGSEVKENKDAAPEVGDESKSSGESGKSV
ncbi:Peptide chain release factor class I/class II [Penicillium expansum]|nr:Peptide chain release factor class I/class II [Penicillium expansum]